MLLRYRYVAESPNAFLRWRYSLFLSFPISWWVDFLTDETPTLSDAVFATISDWFTAAGRPGIVTSFVLVTERLREDGHAGLTVVTPHDQTPARTLGLVGWADEEVRDEIRYIINTPFITQAEPDEDGD